MIKRDFNLCHAATLTTAVPFKSWPRVPRGYREAAVIYDGRAYVYHLPRRGASLRDFKRWYTNAHARAHRKLVKLTGSRGCYTLTN